MENHASRIHHARTLQLQLTQTLVRSGQAVLQIKCGHLKSPNCSVRANDKWIVSALLGYLHILLNNISKLLGVQIFADSPY